MDGVGRVDKETYVRVSIRSSSYSSLFLMHGNEDYYTPYVRSNPEGIFKHNMFRFLEE